MAGNFCGSRDVVSTDASKSINYHVHLPLRRGLNLKASLCQRTTGNQVGYRCGRPELTIFLRDSSGGESAKGWMRRWMCLKQSGENPSK